MPDAGVGRRGGAVGAATAAASPASVDVRHGDFTARIDDDTISDFRNLIDQVQWPRQKRKATHGDGRCLGLTFEFGSGARVGHHNAIVAELARNQC